MPLAGNTSVTRSSSRKEWPSASLVLASSVSVEKARQVPRASQLPFSFDPIYVTTLPDVPLPPSNLSVILVGFIDD